MLIMSIMYNYYRLFLLSLFIIIMKRSCNNENKHNERNYGDRRITQYF